MFKYVLIEKEFVEGLLLFLTHCWFNTYLSKLSAGKIQNTLGILWERPLNIYFLNFQNMFF